MGYLKYNIGNRMRDRIGDRIGDRVRDRVGIALGIALGIEWGSHWGSNEAFMLYKYWITLSLLILISKNKIKKNQ
jgi:hypothetical protein